MTTFQILSLVVATVSILGAIIALYNKNSIAIAQIQVELIQVKRDLMQKEIALCNIEKINREDHKEIMQKLEKIMQK